MLLSAPKLDIPLGEEEYEKIYDSDLSGLPLQPVKKIFEERGWIVSDDGTATMVKMR